VAPLGSGDHGVRRSGSVYQVVIAAARGAIGEVDDDVASSEHPARLSRVAEFSVEAIDIVKSKERRASQVATHADDGDIDNITQAKR
jgi:hypothetical protein